MFLKICGRLHEVNFSGRIFKLSVVALGLLTSANTVYAALNKPGTGGGNSVAWGENY